MDGWHAYESELAANAAAAAHKRWGGRAYVQLVNGVWMVRFSKGD